MNRPCLKCDDHFYVNGEMAVRCSLATLTWNTPKQCQRKRHVASALNTRLRSSPNSLAVRWDQEVAALNLATRSSGPLERGGVDALEAAVGPSAAGVPRVAAHGCAGDQAHLAVAGVVEGRNVGAERRLGTTHMETEITVVPGRVALERQRTRVAVVDESLFEVAEGNGISDNVVRRRVVRDTQLEAVAVSIKGAESPTVVPVAPGIDLLNSDGAAELEEIQTVIDIVPETGIAQHIAGAGTRLACKAIGGLSVLARIPVAVRVKVENRVIGGGTLELEARLVVVVGDETLIPVVGGVTGINAVRAVLESV